MKDFRFFLEVMFRYFYVYSIYKDRPFESYVTLPAKESVFFVTDGIEGPLKDNDWIERKGGIYYGERNWKIFCANLKLLFFPNYKYLYISPFYNLDVHTRIVRNLINEQIEQKWPHPDFLLKMFELTKNL